LSFFVISLKVWSRRPWPIASLPLRATVLAAPFWWILFRLP
jgi:hypothetical protein